MSRLTFPGHVPNALRRCSPVLDADDVIGVVLRIGTTELEASMECFPGPDRRGPLDSFRLQLSSATGRAHLAWWVAEKSCSNAADMPFYRLEWHQPRYSRSAGRRQRRFTIGQLCCWYDRPDLRNYGPVLTELAQLDPDDPTTISDGVRSRLVDAQALRLVALHLAGLTDD